MTEYPEANRSGFAIMSALLGGALWLALLISILFGNRSLGVIELLLLLGVLVLIPLGFDLVGAPDAKGRNPAIYRLARFLQPFASLLAVLSMLIPAGIWSGALAGGWLLFTLCVPLFGLHRIITQRSFRVEENCISAALLYLPVGGAWLVAFRAGLNVGGFGGTVALLTAVHFHYAGFVAPVLAGLAGRQLRRAAPRRWSLYRIAAIGIMAGPPLVALGITFAAALEVAAAVVLAGSLTALATLVLGPIRRSLPDARARAALTISALASVWAMLFALLYALSSFAGHLLVPIPTMALIHGAANALFALGGLTGWGIVRPAAYPYTTETNLSTTEEL